MIIHRPDGPIPSTVQTLGKMANRKFGYTPFSLLAKAPEGSRTLHSVLDPDLKATTAAEKAQKTSILHLSRNVSLNYHFISLNFIFLSVKWGGIIALSCSLAGL